mmetsp:Transcript_139354/g.445654  ORF Transcript_139354/g.445654 Transcript_139354/m.445654 type:complete len:731 (+) Transcript_139354:56-2248(+)
MVRCLPALRGRAFTSVSAAVAAVCSIFGVLITYRSVQSSVELRLQPQGVASGNLHPGAASGGGAVAVPPVAAKPAAAGVLAELRSSTGPPSSGIGVFTSAPKLRPGSASLGEATTRPADANAGAVKSSDTTLPKQASAVEVKSTSVVQAPASNNTLESKKAGLWTLPPRGGGAPTIAFLILGYRDSLRPLWTDPDDKATCAPCPKGVKMLRAASSAYVNAPEQWWCAQRNYLLGMKGMLMTFPTVDFYFLADTDTAVFRESLDVMMHLLQTSVLRAADDLYMGHGYDLSGSKVTRIIMSGGGVLVRGPTLRRLASSGVLLGCIEESLSGQWCYHHLDWTVAECLARINVTASGHPAFQQNTCNEHYGAEVVACHPAKHRRVQQAMIEAHAANFAANKDNLDATWAFPCKSYNWRYDPRSVCKGPLHGAQVEAAISQKITVLRPILPTVAFMVMGDGSTPPWIAPQDNVMMFLPPQNCSDCPASAEKKRKASGNLLFAPKPWWCAQRHYMAAVEKLASCCVGERAHDCEELLHWAHSFQMQHFPLVDYYFLASASAVVFRDSLDALLRLLDTEVLQKDEDLFMGHGYDLLQSKIARIILSDGGILIRGHTLRRLANTGTLSWCIEKSLHSCWCWHHLDWVLAECFARIGVIARGHSAFQQHTCKDSSSPRLVTCHPKVGGSNGGNANVQTLLAAHRSNFIKDATELDKSWAAPCKRYMWKHHTESRCGSEE